MLSIVKKLNIFAPNDPEPSAPFEGPEKLLEIWFAPSADHVPGYASSKRVGLLQVPQKVWEDMLEVVRCKVLSSINGEEIDAYLLSESSLFVSPHKLILKTCGTTLNLYGLPRILDIANKYASFPSVYRCFYSRKAFMFPDRQKGPHRTWKDEVKYLDNMFPAGAAYTVGKVNGDHWLLYITAPTHTERLNTATIPSPTSAVNERTGRIEDYTIEILMSDLSPSSRSSFLNPTLNQLPEAAVAPSSHAIALSTQLGITSIFPAHLTTLDAYAFTPCGYSANALLKHPHGEGYYTIHVTPEAGWSYASFECNVPLAHTGSAPHHSEKDINSELDSAVDIPDLETLIRRVVHIFQPGRLSLTLFISSSERLEECSASDTPIEGAQRAFLSALLRFPSAIDDARRYQRTDKINYEFGGYDLAFASFEIVK